MFRCARSFSWLMASSSQPGGCCQLGKREAVRHHGNIGRVLSLERRRSMMQGLLADRFKLVAHIESKEQPAFALVLVRNDGRLGPSLRHSTAVCSNRQAGRGGEPAADSTNASQTVVCGVRPAGPGKIVLVGAEINQLASALSVPMGRTVFDKTGLTGLYDVELLFTPELPQAPDVPAADAPARGEFTSTVGRDSGPTRLEAQLGEREN